MKNIALVMYHMALGRMLIAQKEMEKKDHQTHGYAEWRFAMNVQKRMARAEMKALEPLIRTPEPTPCKYAIGLDDSSGIICTDKKCQFFEQECTDECGAFQGS